MPASDEFARLLDIMHRLRAECPWDREQTHSSLRAYLLEESYEVLHALDDGDFDDLREELGDLMLQVVFHAELAQEDGRFDIADVLRGINEKLVRRHPHVFADAEADDAEAVLRRWAAIKTQQEKKESVLDGVPDQLPALLQAVRVLSKMRQAGLAPLEVRNPAEEAASALGRLTEAVGKDDADAADRALGLLSLAVTALAARVHANPEDALRRAVRCLSAAFRAEESALKASGHAFTQLSPEELSEMAARVLEAFESEDAV
jgi:MazG family protein